MRKSKEFYDLRESFEKYIQSDQCPIYLGCKIERAKEDKKHFYENGKLNDFFIVYMSGYMNGRINYMQ